MSEVTFSSLLLWILDAAFTGAGVANLVGPKALREAYARWDLPVRYRYIAGIVAILAAILLAGLAGPGYRVAGLVLGAVVLFLAVIKFLHRNEYGAALLGIALLGAVWARALIGPL